MNEFELDRMMNDVVASVANVAVPRGLEQRLKARSFAMNVEANVLTFGSLDGAGGRETGKTVWGAVLLHAAVLLLVFFQMRAMHERAVAPVTVDMVELNAPTPVLPPSARAAGGGGGHAGPAPVTRGNLPKLAAQQVMPPQIHPVEEAKLLMDATVEAQPQMQRSEALQLGMPNSPLARASLGCGRGTGIGGGDGAGIGAGSGGNMGGGLRVIGGGVSAPVPIFTPEPEFSEEARKAKVSGNVLVYLQVDTLGRPMHVRVLNGIGMGLDERAVAAVRQYRFKPARENGVAVPVEMQVEVNFQIF